MAGLDDLLRRLEGRRAAAVGDLMLDRFVYGVVERISPESPTPVMSLSRETRMLGGVGNVARNLAALGLDVRLCALVGADAGADALRYLAAAADGVQADLIVDAGRPTTVKTRFVAAGQQLLRLDEESLEAAGAPAEAALAAAAEKAAEEADVVLVSDYAKGAAGPAVLEATRRAADRRGVPVLVDPKGRDFARYGPVRLIKPNAKELALVTGRPTASDEEVEGALARALELCAAQAVLVTRAGAGMSLLERGGAVRHFRGEARQVFDVSGAGDTALAALGAGLAAGAPLEAAVTLALLASGVVVGKIGTAVASPAELRRAERAQPAAGGVGAKVVDLAAAREEARAWRDGGLRVGFTNGCFDVLHRGHVTYLAAARASCDRLIVGLNTDGSVRALKGEGRPVNDLESRALVLAGLSCVDLVVPFAEADPLALIEALRPDLLMKGADYALDQVVGADLVRSYGGAVALVPLVEGYSTTQALERWRSRT